MNKDEILQQIIDLENNLIKSREKYTETQEQTKHLKDKVETTRKAYDTIKEQLDLAGKALTDSRDNYQDTQYTLNTITREGKDYQSKLESLKRELARTEDAERINAEYLRQVEEFREKSLSAPWRKENRTDGYGAYEHQIEGAIHCAVAQQALLGDKRGLGKSLTGLIYADLRDARKVIVVCPPDTMDNYIREIKLWAPHRSVMKIGKMTKGARDFLLPALKSQAEFTLVFNYEAWRKDKIFIQDMINLKADTIIYDEAHKAKEINTVTCQGIIDIRFGLNICPGCDNPNVVGIATDVNRYCCHSCKYEGFITDFCSIKNVLPMTGTPILNRPQELFPHLKMIDPKNFIKLNTFLRDFCRKDYSGHWTWQYGAEKELMEKIGPRYIARDRKSAGIVIPPATPVDHIITNEDFKENYPKQYKAYEQVRQYAQLVLDPENNTVMRMNYMIVVLMRLRQVLAWPAAIVLKTKDEDGVETVQAKLDVHESVKLDKAQEIISEVTEEGDAVLGFSMFVDPLYELEKRLSVKHRVGTYTGDTSDYMKNKYQLDFDPKTAGDKPRWDVLLGTYGAMGTGLNLNRATHAVMIDRFWNPGGEDQAEGRIDRIGTTKDTYIHRIMVESTVDTWMASIIDEKASLIGGFSSQADLMQEVYRAIREGDM